MRRVLILSPHFPPVNSADIHRVRLSLPYFREFGWDPVVLAVAHEHVEAIHEPLLLETVPSEVPVHRVRALPVRLMRTLGVGAIALRALPFLFGEGLCMIRRYRPDLVYISTTAFQAMVLGRLWKDTTGIPFVLDMQDPWVPDSEQIYAHRNGFKHQLAARIHEALEPWTMRRVNGLVAVSESYNQVLRRRYPWINSEVCAVLPFGADALDHEIASQAASSSKFFQPDDGYIHGVYTGRLGPDMVFSCKVICAALKEGLERWPNVFSKVRLYFIGTDYASGNAGRATILPLAAEDGISHQVSEHPGRVPYFTALRLQQEADFLLVPGSVDPAYTASKIYSFILAHRPLLAVFHEASSVVKVLNATQAGEIVTFRSREDVHEVTRRLMAVWVPLLQKLPFTPRVNWQAFEAYSAREMTRRQCELFHRVVDAKPSTGHVR